MAAFLNTLLQLFDKNVKTIFWGLLVAQLVAMLIMSQQVGSSADEYRHIKQAAKVYNYFETNGYDASALEDTGIDPMQLNGQSFDNFMYLLTTRFEIKNYMEFRHLFNALFGWLIILITGFIAKEFWGYKGAILAVFLLFITPRFLGHALNNNKDIPFAFGFILSFYGIILFLKDLPKLKPKAITILTLGIAMAISIRIAGLLSIGLLALFSTILFAAQEPRYQLFHKNKIALFKSILLAVPLISILGYFLGIAFWPYMLEAPISHLKQVLAATSSHPISLNQLFEGRLVMSDRLPSYYVLKWTLISYPLVLMVGSAFALLFLGQAKKKNKLKYLFITFSFFFVLAWMGLRQSNFYGGIRHLLFIYPLAILIAVTGFKFLSEYLKKKNTDVLRLVPFILIILCSIHPVSHIIRNYPYSYIYFNEISGGMDKVYDKYETDYFQHSIRRATEWLTENELPNMSNKEPIIVATNDEKNCSYWARHNTLIEKVVYTHYYEKYSADWDYAVYYCGYITPYQITHKLWPPVGTIHTETVDGFPIAAVVKRPSKEDLKGFQSVDEDPELAKAHFEQYLEEYPANEQILEGLGEASLYLLAYDNAVDYAKQSLQQNPNSVSALWLLTSALMASERYSEVPAVCDQITGIRIGFYLAYHNKGLALTMMDRPEEAAIEFSKALEYTP